MIQIRNPKTNGLAVFIVIGLFFAEEAMPKYHHPIERTLQLLGVGGLMAARDPKGKKEE